MRVLDLGCAQGFFSLHLSALGAEVHGVDYLDTSIAVCTALAEELEDASILFETAKIEDVLLRTEAGQYDLVLGFSVFHHIIHENGASFARRVLNDLGGKTYACLFEMALADEPLFWAAAQPKSPLRVLDDFAFVHEIARHETHLSQIQRPLYFASNHCWFLGGHAGMFESWRQISSQAGDTYEGTRRIYFGDGRLVKLYRLDNEKRRALNLKEWRNECKFLDNPPAGFHAPQLGTHARNASQAWLVREYLPGETLGSLIASGRVAENQERIVEDVLSQLVVLEAAGLYHNDVRTWNVLIGPDGRSRLIDFGSITPRREDCAWPEDVFLSFLIFMREVFGAAREPPVPVRSLWLNPDTLPGPFRRAAWRLLRSPVEERRFSNLDEEIREDADLVQEDSGEERDSLRAVLEAMEAASRLYREHLAHLANEKDQSRQRIEELEHQLADGAGDVAKLVRTVEDLRTQAVIQTETHSEAVAVWERTHAALNQELAERDQKIEGLVARAAELETQHAALNHELAERGQKIEGLVARAAELETQHAALNHELAERGQKIEGLVARAAELETQIGWLHQSTSWRVTAPLRVMRRGLKYLARGSSAWLMYRPDSRPRRVARRAIVALADSVAKRKRLRALVVAALARFPLLDDRLRRTLRTHRVLQTPRDLYRRSTILSSGMRLRPGGVGVTALPPPEDSGQRVLYLFVNHTVQCLVNTGVQRVTRGFGLGLAGLGGRVRYVKWDTTKNACVLINSDEREFLARWNGPSISADELGVYPAPTEPAVAIDPSASSKNSWLIVPEVPHLSPFPRSITLDLVSWARTSGLRAGFVFYDAIPLRLEEFADLAPAHTNYMKHLRLADVVWPISRWSSSDLVSYWTEYEGADSTTMPDVHSVHLPGDYGLCERATSYQEGENLILVVGTIEPRKNQLLIIRTFREYLAKNPKSSWQLALVGNLHPLVAEEVRASATGRIQYLGTVSDDELRSIYDRCAFTVFSSIDEGFGLPILESIWHGKPCLCANFGAMGEVAEGGGCLTVDMRDSNAVGYALARMIDDPTLRRSLAVEAIARPMKSWMDYATQVHADVEKRELPRHHLGIVYFWIDSTRSFSNNTGIQRVTRQLSRSLMSLGLRVVPVIWGGATNCFRPAATKDLVHLARWNGPAPERWASWIDPKSAPVGSWFLLPELPLNLTKIEQAAVRSYATVAGLKTAAIFHDTIPWKLRDMYPQHFSIAHHDYMLEIGQYDLIMATSDYVRDDLVTFLGGAMEKPQSLERVVATILPGEFSERSRVIEHKRHRSETISILAVGTVEPRKNHETLLKAFTIAQTRSVKPLGLTIVGRGDVLDMVYLERIRSAVAADHAVVWIEDADDTRLQALYAAADFTVYPSIEEGFGLPILESLWNGTPCICADFGAMAEAATGGGCLTVDVQDADELADAIVCLADDGALATTLARDARIRPFRSWKDYALDVAWRMVEKMSRPRSKSLPMSRDEIRERSKAMRIVQRARLSVCISTYNRSDWLAASLKNWERIYPEPLEGVELLVCDNASTDCTPNVVKPYLRRPDFSYSRNPANIGMLGNLRATADAAQGQYLWILGDDDLIMPGAIERVLQAIDDHPDVGLVYLNYAFTGIKDVRSVSDFELFCRGAKPIVPAESDRVGSIREICARNENFFTAIYTLVFRRDHALIAYSQNTSGRPFSTMLTCIPTTYHVLHNMMDALGVWIGTPQVVVNLNVSWLKYAPLWILERIPEVYEVAETMGVSAAEIDRWRRHTLPSVANYFHEIYASDPIENAAFFDPARLVRRFKHLSEFRAQQESLAAIYRQAQRAGHPAARAPVATVFPNLSDDALVASAS